MRTDMTKNAKNFFAVKRDTTTGILYQEKIGGAFGRSKFVTDKIAVPPDMLQNTFGKAFKVEEGRVVAYGDDGNKIYSRAVRVPELCAKSDKGSVHIFLS